MFSLSSNRTFRPTLRASYIYTEILDFSTGLLHPHIALPGLLHQHRNLVCLPWSITPTHKFGISPRVSYTHTEIWDTTPTQKFVISPRVSYTHTEIRDSSSGLLHPHRNLGSLPWSLTPTQKFGIAPPGLLHPHRNLGSLPGSLTPTQKFRISLIQINTTHIYLQNIY